MRPLASPAQVDAMKRALGQQLGDDALITDPDLLPKYGEDWSGGVKAAPDFVVRARSTEDVVAVLRAANQHGVPVTPRGLGTGKAGGCVPIHGGCVLSMERMNRIHEVNREDMLVVADPGVITADLMSAVEAENLFYPPDPNSLNICSIGGNVACNAGGPRALKYGVTKNYVLGLEIVLPTGERMHVGKRTLKHVTGYDISSMIVGSEGTLGVITQVTLKLVPKPLDVQTALVSFSSLGDAARAISAVLSAGIVPRTLELLDPPALAAVRVKTPGRFPDNAAALLILETDGSSAERAFEDLAQAAERCQAAGALEVLVAQNDAQRERIWEPRRLLSVTLSESAPKKISEDIVVPRSQITSMLEEVTRIGERHRLRVASYGHAGDGNLHVNVLFDSESEARAHAAVRDVMEATVRLGGTISGEHGIGLLKRDFMALEQAEPLLALQRRLKATLDPQGILNPGKVLPGRGPTND